MPVPSPKQTRQRLGILFSLPLFFCLLFFLLQVAAEDTDTRLLQIQNLESDVNRLDSLAKNIESSERGFLLTGDLALLSPFEAAQRELPRFKEGMQDLGNLRPKMQELASKVQARLNEAQAVLEAQRANGFAAAIALTKGGHADSTMNDMQRESDGLRKKLSELETGSLKHQHWLNNIAILLFGVGTIAMIGVMYWLYNEVLSYISALGQAQQQLETFNADLQTMVDDRTRELVEANRELQQFAYVASHDLQEPLRTITSFSQLLAARYQGKLDDDADEFIGYIVTASKRMTDLINGLLQIVKLRRAAQPTTRVSFDKLLDDAEVSLQASIRENGVRIERGPMPELMVDRVQMLQVLQNLLSNAIKYRSSQTPLVRVSATRSNTEWTIAVKDNGRGFGQEFSERIFGLFQRLHVREVEGTGMGLSIARRIIERHGGRIWAESKEGQGASFFFALPVNLEAPKASTPASALEQAATSGVPARAAKARV